MRYRLRKVVTAAFMPNRNHQSDIRMVRRPLVALIGSEFYNSHTGNGQLRKYEQI
jgi:hypothetical protein